MKKTIEQTLEALCEINNRYHRLIKADPILRQDFAELMECSERSDTMILQNYQKVVERLITESDDNQRMANEGPQFLRENSDAYNHLQERRDLNRALDIYQANYLAG